MIKIPCRLLFIDGKLRVPIINDYNLKTFIKNLNKLHPKYKDKFDNIDYNDINNIKSVLKDNGIDIINGVIEYAESDDSNNAIWD